VASTAAPRRCDTASRVSGVRLEVGRCNPACRDRGRQGRGGLRTHLAARQGGLLCIRCLSEVGELSAQVDRSKPKASHSTRVYAVRPQRWIVSRLIPQACRAIHAVLRFISRTIALIEQHAICGVFRTLTQFISQITTPSLSSASMAQPTGAGWSSLPAFLAEQILVQAFEDSNRALLAWLRMGLVCRCATSHAVGPAGHQSRISCICCYQLYQQHRSAARSVPTPYSTHALVV